MILSIDVGIKNLAVCILGMDKSIKEWKVINLLGEPPCCEYATCKKTARHSTPKGYRCGLHSRMFETAPPLLTKLRSRRRVAKKVIATAFTEYDVNSEESLIDALCSKYKTALELPKVSEISFTNICKGIIKHLVPLLETYDITTILIENQPSRIAPVMKNVQSALTMFFVTQNCKNIRYMSACNKLKKNKGTGPTDYATRKRTAVELIRSQLNDSPFVKVFEEYTKKDDLADCYLQAISYLEDSETALLDA